MCGSRQCLFHRSNHTSAANFYGDSITDRRKLTLGRTLEAIIKLCSRHRVLPTGGASLLLALCNFVPSQNNVDDCLVSVFTLTAVQA